MRERFVPTIFLVKLQNEKRADKCCAKKIGMHGGGRVRLDCLLDLARGNRDEYEYACKQQERVKHVRDKVECADLSVGERGRNSGKRYEHLRAVRQDPLHHAAEDIQERSRLLRRNAVLVAHLLCDRARHHDSDRVVCRRDIERAHQKAHANLPAAVPLEYFVYKVQQCREAAVDTDQPAQGTHQHRDENRLVHPRNAVPDILQKTDHVERAEGDHDDRSRDNAHQQYREHVDTRERERQHENVGDELN